MPSRKPLAQSVEAHVFVREPLRVELHGGSSHRIDVSTRLVEILDVLYPLIRSSRLGTLRLRERNKSIPIRIGMTIDESAIATVLSHASVVSRMEQSRFQVHRFVLSKGMFSLDISQEGIGRSHITFRLDHEEKHGRLCLQLLESTFRRNRWPTFCDGRSDWGIIHIRGDKVYVDVSRCKSFKLAFASNELSFTAEMTLEQVLDLCHKFILHH